ncbi:unknown [Clostridium sp. CAG:609]|jgi:hypothetical protein|nr:unknown [Clostridium sp. CAG:609]
MNFFEKFGFLEDEQKEYEDITPEEIKKMISKHNKLVETNLQFLKDLEINTYKEIFINYPDMFLMDASNFEKYFNRYEKEALQEKLNTNYKVVKFL